MGILKTFDGYVLDPKIPAEELPDYAIKLIESKKGGALKWLKSIFFPDRAKGASADELIGTMSLGEIPVVNEPAPPPENAAPRKSLDDIFGTKK